MFKKNEKQKVDEIKLLKDRIIKLEREMARKPSDDINEARHALKKCSEYRNRCMTTEEEINKYKQEIKNNLNFVNQSKNDIEGVKSKIEEVHSVSIGIKNKINELQVIIENFESIYENHDELKDNLNELSNIYDSTSELSEKVNAIYSNVKKKSSDVNELSYEVFGYTEYDEDEDKDIHVKGLKDNLEESFNTISNDLKDFESELSIKMNSFENDITTIKQVSVENFDKFTTDKNKIHEGLLKEINELMPKALTAGLSFAYSEKRLNEIDEGKKLQKVFSKSILGLVGISLIPFAVSLFQLFDGVSLKSVIEDMPRLILSIFPLYMPVVWLAYSSNKKINLSKRLVEEYTHKEVLSKTFAGLSKQIEELPNSETAEELRTKLLFNILSVNSENPGKLISDYDKVDHPLMDALDKSAKLSDAVDTVSKIPGLSKLSVVLENKANKIKEIQKNKIEEGLSIISDKEKMNLENDEKMIS